MELSATEKLLLTNQYEILKRLDPAMEKEYNVLLKCLYDGYEKDLDQLLPHFEPPLSEDVTVEVRDILDMFRALKPHFDTPAAAAFVGFDGNEEADHFAYAVFLLEDRGLWRESRRDDYNTHYPVLPKYREMLRRWRGAADKRRLGSDEMKHIAAAAPHGSQPSKAA